MMCQKSFCVAGATLLPRFQKMRCMFCDRRSTLDTSDVILRGRRSTFDVSCCVFSVNRIVRAARSGDKVQIPWHACVACKSLHKKTRRNTSILTLRSVNFEDVSHEMLVLMLQHVSSRIPGFCGAVAMSMGEAAKPFLVEGFKAGCNLVLRGRHGTS